MSKRFSASEAKEKSFNSLKKFEEQKKFRESVEQELDAIFEQIDEATENGKFEVEKCTNITDEAMLIEIKNTLKMYRFNVLIEEDEDHDHNNDPSFFFEISWSYLNKHKHS